MSRLATAALIGVGCGLAIDPVAEAVGVYLVVVMFAHLLMDLRDALRGERT